MAGPERQAAGNAAVAEFSAYLDDLVAERRKRPADDRDVLGTLIHGEVDGERLTHDELVQNCIFLLNAGHETTTNLIGNTIDALLRFPDELQRLQENPALLKSCVEEGLRFESSNQLGNRRLASDLEIGGETLAAGTYIHIGIGAANRDPAQFAEPDRFDAGREPNRHFAFGSGVHMCLGAVLARMEGTIAIGRLVDRFDGLHSRRHPRARRPRPLPRLQQAIRSLGTSCRPERSEGHHRRLQPGMRSFASLGMTDVRERPSPCGPGCGDRGRGRGGPRPTISKPCRR